MMAEKPDVASGTRAQRKLIRARSSLLLKHPFFASLAMRLHLQEDKTCRSAWTDGESFAYNPDYVNVLSDEKLLGLTAHLVMHPACGHHLRRGDRDFKRWNQACDYAINTILLDAGFTLPDSLHQREEFSGMGAEDIYRCLAGETDKQEKEKGEEEAKGKESEQLEANEQEQGEEEFSEENMAAGEVRDAPSLTGEKEQGREQGSPIEWEEALLSAASQAKEMGKIPDGIARLVEQQLRPQLPWQELLSRFVQRTARSDYSWTMPNRRYLHLGFYFPALIQDELQQIVVAIDVSGSVDDRILQSFISEVSAIMEQMPSCLHLFCCDADIQFYQQFTKADIPININELQIKGGGGTDFRPVFARIEKEQIVPACLIYLTDMECLLYPDSAPEYPVLWIKNEEPNSMVSMVPLAPFGEIISMKSQ